MAAKLESQEKADIKLPITLRKLKEWPQSHKEEMKTMKEQENKMKKFDSELREEDADQLRTVQGQIQSDQSEYLKNLENQDQTFREDLKND